MKSTLQPKRLGGLYGKTKKAGNDRNRSVGTTGDAPVVTHEVQLAPETPKSTEPEALDPSSLVAPGKTEEREQPGT